MDTSQQIMDTSPHNHGHIYPHTWAHLHKSWAHMTTNHGHIPQIRKTSTQLSTLTNHGYIQAQITHTHEHTHKPCPPATHGDIPGTQQWTQYTQNHGHITTKSSTQNIDETWTHKRKACTPTNHGYTHKRTHKQVRLYIICTHTWYTREPMESASHPQIIDTHITRCVCTHYHIFIHGRRCMTIDPRILTMPGRSTSGLHRPGIYRY